MAVPLNRRDPRYAQKCDNPDYLGHTPPQKTLNLGELHREQASQRDAAPHDRGQAEAPAQPEDSAFLQLLGGFGVLGFLGFRV